MSVRFLSGMSELVEMLLRNVGDCCCFRNARNTTKYLYNFLYKRGRKEKMDKLNQAVQKFTAFFCWRKSTLLRYCKLVNERFSGLVLALEGVGKLSVHIPLSCLPTGVSRPVVGQRVAS